MEDMVAALEASLSEDQARLRSAAEFLTQLSRERFCWLLEALAFLLCLPYGLLDLREPLCVVVLEQERVLRPRP